MAEFQSYIAYSNVMRTCTHKHIVHSQFQCSNAKYRSMSQLLMMSIRTFPEGKKPQTLSNPERFGISVGSITNVSNWYSNSKSIF